MADKTLKHLVFMRFFSWQAREYPQDIFDADFLSAQLPLANNALRSLENQTNKNFELIFVLHPNFFDNSKYEFIFSTLKDSTTLPIQFMRNTGKFYLFKPELNGKELNGELCRLIKDTTSKYDFVITTRMDFDDFIFKEAVEDTQSKINECDSVLSYGYNKGYEYIITSHELYPSKYSWPGHHSVFQSLILKSSFAEKLPCFTVEEFNHNRSKDELKRFLETNGVKFSENMFQQDDSINAYVYVRHEASYMALARNGGKIPIQYSSQMITKGITKKQLEDEFGFHLELNSIE